MAKTKHSYDKKTTYIKDTLSQKEKDDIEDHLANNPSPNLTLQDTLRIARERAAQKQKQAV